MTDDRPTRSSAFLLTQIGTAAAERFAGRVAEIGLTPPECGVLGLLRGRPGLSQVELGKVLGMIPSRVVPLVDGLERAGLLERVRDEADRRRNALQLTGAGRKALTSIGRIGRAHDLQITGALTAAQRSTLADLLARIADDLGLTPGVHPGYRTMPGPDGP